MLNLYQLQMFLAVVDSGSFSAAATQLHVTQPAVSEGVRALEQRLGSRLFDRRGHRAAVTPEGAALIEQARGLLAMAERTEQSILGQRGVISGTLRLATATSAGGPVLAGRLGEFARAHPAVGSTLVVRDPAAVLDGLRAGEFDVGFLGEPARGARLTHLQVATDEWVFLVPPGHPWLAGGPAPEPGPGGEPGPGPARRKRGRPPARRPGMPARPSVAVPAAALGTQPLVLENAESILGAQARRELRDLLDERDLAWTTLRLVLELVTPSGVLQAVEAGAGIGILALSQLLSYAGPLTPVRAEGKPLLRQLYAVRDPRVAPAPLTAAWWDFLAAGEVPSIKS
ncbi:MAG TPA: LysR family transcriptional regulator [Chloroflexia bacterium]|nr:LysR family transcriptional regulator [Chloroflexia bacterium]